MNKGVYHKIIFFFNFYIPLKLSSSTLVGTRTPGWRPNCSKEHLGTQRFGNSNSSRVLVRRWETPTQLERSSNSGHRMLWLAVSERPNTVCASPGLPLTMEKYAVSDQLYSLEYQKRDEVRGSVVPSKRSVDKFQRRRTPSSGMCRHGYTSQRVLFIATAVKTSNFT
jgi:hypothetical protein